MIYLDSCAIVKLIRNEDGSAGMQAWVDARPGAVVITSEIAVAEVERVIRRSNHTDQGLLVDSRQLEMELDEARSLLEGIGFVSVDRALLASAGALAAPMLRTLDAIHLVSALLWERASVEFVTYDTRLATLAADAGLAVVSPS